MKKKQEYPQAPEYLSDKSKKLWGEYVGEEIKSPGRLELFRVALESLDRIDEARQIIATEGLTIATGKTGLLHGHPVLAIEKEAKGTFLKIWKTLFLDRNGRFEKDIFFNQPAYRTGS
jgi:phage terminase small subunit